MKRLIKRMVFAVAWLLASPLILLCWLESAVSRGEWVFTGCAQLLALIAGPPGVQLRAAFYFSTLERASWEIHIGFGSMFTHRGAKLGPNVSTGAYCVIGHADIAGGVMMGSRVSIPSGKRQHFDEHGEIVATARYDTVAIGEGCWLGEACIVLAEVGAGSVVSAGAVVIRPMPARSIIGGNPAQVIRSLP